jgi:hypothetical protein
MTAASVIVAVPEPETRYLGLYAQIIAGFTDRRRVRVVRHGGRTGQPSAATGRAPRIGRLSALVPAPVRYAVVAAGVALLLVLDLAGRTPRMNRQTPQRLSTMPPAVRGFLWGWTSGCSSPPSRGPDRVFSVLQARSFRERARYASVALLAVVTTLSAVQALP